MFKALRLRPIFKVRLSLFTLPRINPLSEYEALKTLFDEE